MYEKHPIQIGDIRYTKLYLEINADFRGEELNQGDFQLQTGRSAFNESEKAIWVRSRCLVGFDEHQERLPNAPFWLEVEVEAFFEVDVEQFDASKVEHWAEYNAPLTLYPYVRESVMMLSVRAFGEDKILLPLLTVPTYKVEANSAG